MPVLRYFVFVGGALLALLFACNAVVPQVPLPESIKSASASDMPMVRIKSERKWPERVVFDTTVASGAPVNIAKIDMNADTAKQVAAADDSQTSRTRDAFAQMGTTGPKQQAMLAAQPAALKVADATAPKAADLRSDLTRTESKPQSKRKVAKLRPSRPMIIVAQQPQPHFGFFDSTW
jgi:hypothetical protein